MASVGGSGRFGVVEMKSLEVGMFDIQPIGRFYDALSFKNVRKRKHDTSWPNLAYSNPGLPNLRQFKRVVVSNYSPGTYKRKSQRL
jgi:hypothetical protein